MRKLFFSFLLALLVSMAADAQEMYAVYDGNDTFTFYYDNEKESRSGEVYDFTLDKYGFPQWSGAEWRKSVRKVVFYPSFADARPTTTSGWFSYFENMAEIEGMEYLNTSEVTDMSYMFLDCYAIATLDVSHFDTRNVMSMHGMFSFCHALTALDVSHFDTRNVKSMGSMFSYCYALTALDVSHFDTRNVTNMNVMFGFCFTLAALDVSHFDTRNVTNMTGMFCDCYALTALDVSHFDTRNVTYMKDMFRMCSSLTTIYCNDDWNADGLESEGMFSGCRNLVGGAGTVYGDGKTDVTMAHPDSADNPGYFTRKAGGSGEWAEGDLNHDGKVDAADVVVLVNMILNQK